jgi:hypothetical protein
MVKESERIKETIETLETQRSDDDEDEDEEKMGHSRLKRMVGVLLPPSLRRC